MWFWRGKTLTQTRAFLPGHLQTDTHTHSRQLIQRHPYRTRAHVRLKIPSWTQRQRDAGMGTLQAQPHTQRRCTQIQMHIRRNAFYSQMETDTCSHSPSEVHTCSARTHGLADAQTCSENTDVHQVGQMDPQTQPFICSRDSRGAPPVCQVSSGVRNTSGV